MYLVVLQFQALEAREEGVGLLGHPIITSSVGFEEPLGTDHRHISSLKALEHGEVDLDMAGFGEELDLLDRQHVSLDPSSNIRCQLLAQISRDHIAQVAVDGAGGDDGSTNLNVVVDEELDVASVHVATPFLYDFDCAGLGLLWAACFAAGLAGGRGGGLGSLPIHGQAQV